MKDQYGHWGNHYIQLGNTNNTYEIRQRDTIEIPHISYYDQYIDYHMIEKNSGSAELKELALMLSSNEINDVIGLITNGDYSQGANGSMQCAATIRRLLKYETETYKELSRFNNLLFVDTPKSIYDDLKEINEDIN